MLSRQRKHIAVRRGLREDSSDSDGTSRTSVHYLASQYLADSSLNSDVSQFDFATSVMPLCTLSLPRLALVSLAYFLWSPSVRSSTSEV